MQRQPLEGVSEAMPNDYHGAIKYYNLGVQSGQNGDLGNAEQYFRKSIKACPDYADGHFNLGITLSALGRIEEAKEAYREAIRCKPAWIAPYSNLGFELARQELWHDAAEVLLKGLDCDSSIAENDLDTLFNLYLNLASVFRHLERAKESEDMFRRAIEIRPADANCHSLFGFLLAQEGRYEEAEAEFRESISCDSGFALGHYNLGVTLWQTGRSAESEEAFREAIRCNPDYANAYHYLACLHVARDQYAAAVENFREVLRIDPDNKDVDAECKSALDKMTAIEKIHLDLRDDIRRKEPKALSAYNSIFRGEFKVVWKSLGLGPL